MTARIQFALLLALLLLPSSSRAQPTPDNADPNITAQKRTVVDIRNVGTAMWSWYKDQVAPRRSAASHARAEKESQISSVDFTQVPVISREDLTALLVPKYIAAIPSEDGWGHPYEFRLNTKDPDATTVMGVRSGGRDGQLSGDSYAVDGFKVTDFDQDITWIDGYFARWPEKPKPAR
ncbi:MAG: hypothetical protein ACJ76N_25015 [Thermoanaerobaculia bacterium]